jgi:hypothetical protein
MQAAATLDVDGDNLLDVAYVPGSNADYSTMGILLNKGGGNFLSGGVFVSGGTYAGIATADVDGDGRVDVITPHFDTALTIQRNLGNGTFAAPVYYDVGRRARLAVAKDMNGDGWLDIITSNDAMRGTSLLLNKGDGTFAPFRHFPVDVNDIAIGDMNMDGKPDVVCAKQFTTGILFNTCLP